MRKLLESEFERGEIVLYDNSVPCEIIGVVSDGTYDIEPINHDQYWNHMRSVSADKLMKIEEDQLHESNLYDKWGDDPESLCIEKYDDDSDWAVLSHDCNDTYYVGSSRQDCINWCQDHGEKYYFYEESLKISSKGTSLSESWEDEYEDFDDYDEMVKSTIQYELDYDPIPNESAVEDFIESISDLSYESIELTNSENEVYDVEYDEDSDPVTASASFDLQFAIHMSSLDDAKKLLDILEEESTVTAEDYLSRNYYIEYLDIQSMSCSISDTIVYLNIDGNVDINAMELVGSLA